MSRQLDHLRADLRAMARRRWSLRIGAALAVCLSSAGWILVGLFAADLLLWIPRLERGVLLLASMVLTGMLIWRVLWPAVRSRDSELDLALQLEKRHQVTPDFVAALQFTCDDNVRYGSVSLQEAVIRRAATIEQLPSLHSPELHSPFLRSSIGLMTTACAIFALVSVWPMETRIFLDRLLLGNARYPTRTEIIEFVVNGEPIPPFSDSARRILVPEGNAVEFFVRAHGEIPGEGVLQILSAKSRVAMSTPLRKVRGADSTEPVTAEARFETSNPDSQTEGNILFHARLDRLSEPVDSRITLGDVSTDAIQLVPVARPVITVSLQAIPPAYAAALVNQSAAQSAQRIAALAGSRVEIEIDSANKPLSSVTVLLDGQRLPLVPVDTEKRSWRLPEADSPFATVTRPLQFSVEALDADGLAPSAVPAGSISIRPDHSPRVGAAMTTTSVVPTAKPQIAWNAHDDFGLSDVRLTWTIRRGGMDAGTDELPIAKIPTADRPTAAMHGHFSIPLSSWKLRAGDEVELRILASDDRGAAAGETGHSAPILLHIVDEAGILNEISLDDERALEQLDTLIEQQLSTGGRP